MEVYTVDELLIPQHIVPPRFIINNLLTLSQQALHQHELQNMATILCNCLLDTETPDVITLTVQRRAPSADEDPYQLIVRSLISDYPPLNHWSTLLDRLSNHFPIIDTNNRPITSSNIDNKLFTLHSIRNHLNSTYSVQNHRAILSLLCHCIADIPTTATYTIRQSRRLLRGNPPLRRIRLQNNPSH